MLYGNQETHVGTREVPSGVERVVARPLADIPCLDQEECRRGLAGRWTHLMATPAAGNVENKLTVALPICWSFLLLLLCAEVKYAA